MQRKQQTEQQDSGSEAGRWGGASRRRIGYLAGGAMLALVGAGALVNFGPNPTTLESVPDPVAAATPAVAAEAAADASAVEAAALDEQAVTRLTPHVYEPVPAAQRVPKPEHVRGIYLNVWAAASPQKLTRLIELAHATEINSFVIDVKEVGEISYRSAVPLAYEIGATRDYIPNIRRVLDRLRENGIYPIARIVVFRDEVLATARPELSIVRADGSIWVDSHGHGWVDSYNREVWDYNIAIAREAIELGFSEIQWDYVRFPDVPQALMREAVWPAQEGRSKADAIRAFLLYAREQLADLEAPLTADVFGLVTSSRNDMGIGQQWEKIVDAVDAILPMVYPSHYARGSYGIAIPNARPYQTIRTALTAAVRRSEGVPNAALIRPWLQDFTLGQPRYGPAHVRAQIRGVYDAGLHEWILWNPGSNYTVGALATADGVVPDLPIPDTDLIEEPADSTAAPDSGAPRLLGRPVGGG